MFGIMELKNFTGNFRLTTKIPFFYHLQVNGFTKGFGSSFYNLSRSLIFRH